MILFHRSRDNGKDEPWLRENNWVFEITFDWKQFLIGVCFAGGVASASFGPFSVVFYHIDFSWGSNGPR